MLSGSCLIALGIYTTHSMHYQYLFGVVGVEVFGLLRTIGGQVGSIERRGETIGDGGSSLLTAVGFEALLGFVVNGFEVGCDGKAVACHFHIDITRVLGFEFFEIIPKDIIVLDEFAPCKTTELLL